MRFYIILKNQFRPPQSVQSHACKACMHVERNASTKIHPGTSPSFHQFPLQPLACCSRTDAHTPVGLVVLFVVVVQNAQVVVRQRLRPRFVRAPARKPAHTHPKADKLFLKFAAGDFKHKYHAAANRSVHHRVHLGPCCCPACVYARARVWKFILCWLGVAIERGQSACAVQWCAQRWQLGAEDNSR
jgi:hypothetical protein